MIDLKQANADVCAVIESVLTRVEMMGKERERIAPVHIQIV
jgi:hypothetical protein